MGEETKNSKTAVPRGMFWSIVFNGIVGLIMLFAYMVSMDPSMVMHQALGQVVETFLDMHATQYRRTY